MPEGRSTVPEGRSDRSLARSAWNSPPQKNRPVGHGMIGRRPGCCPLTPMGADCELSEPLQMTWSQRYFASKGAVFFKEG
jgi:hypothetical protein